jgi:hypothetical protein
LRKIWAGAGYAFCQQNPYLVDQPAGVAAMRQIFSVTALPARTFRQVADFKIKLISSNCHDDNPLAIVNIIIARVPASIN